MNKREKMIKDLVDNWDGCEDCINKECGECLGDFGSILDCVAEENNIDVQEVYALYDPYPF